MNPFIVSLLSAATAYAFVHLTGSPNLIRRLLRYCTIITRSNETEEKKDYYLLPIKPLDCHTCLSFWVCFAYITFCEASYSLFEGWAHCFLAMIISQLIYLILKRI